MPESTRSPKQCPRDDETSGRGWLLSVRSLDHAHEIALLEESQCQKTIAAKVVGPTVDRNQHRVIFGHLAQTRARATGSQDFPLDGPRLDAVLCVVWFTAVGADFVERSALRSQPIATAQLFRV